MITLPRWRNYLLRFSYAFIAFGLIATLWQEIFSATPSIELQRSVVLSLLSTMALLSIVGMFRPILMLPVLLFELVWKVIWLVVFWLRLWSSSSDAGVNSTFFACVLGVVLCAIAIPWRQLLSSMWESEHT